MVGRRGFTVIELMMVITLAGIMMLVGFPKLMNSLEHNDVRGARGKVVALFNRARASAIESNRHVTFRVNPTLVVITQSVPGGGVDTVSIEDFSGAGVGLVTSASSIQIDPRGLATSLGSSTATIALSKGSHADTVLISGFGRVMSQ